jgi:CRP-like cAMP-binding protein
MNYDYLDYETILHYAMIIIKNNITKLYSPQESLLITRFLMRLEYFSNLENTMGQGAIEKMIRYLNIKHYEPGDVVVTFGELKRSFYIIFKGELDVMIPDFGNYRRSGEFKKIATMEMGKSFGEMAIIRKKPRTATVICATHCILAEIDYEDYLTLFKTDDEQNIEEVCDFLKTFDFFKKIARSYLERFYFIFEKKVFKSGDVVFQEGDELSHNGIYFIYKGEFLVNFIFYLD